MRAAASSRSTPPGVVPAASDATEACWMTGPSIIGSEKGMPTSTASAPAAATASTTSIQFGTMPAIT
jgi:hypothetical protein